VGVHVEELEYLHHGIHREAKARKEEVMKDNDLVGLRLRFNLGF
jgi:hypothetical protein